MCEALDELYKEEIDKRVNKLADAKAEALAKEHLTNQIKKKIANAILF